MELTELKDRIIAAYKGAKEDLVQILEMVEQDKAVFPFNEYELMLNTFIAKQTITYEQYLDIRAEYMAHNRNLWVFEISAPRGFGETFAQTFVLNQSNKIQSASKKLDKDYHGQYDLWLDGIRIEVKASRMVDAESDEPLYKKALSSNTQRPFLMNFQQLKPDCCDVFVWLAVYRDKITIWVMNAEEVSTHKDYSKGQHRGNHGNEGQLHVTQSNIKTLKKYEFRGSNLASAIKRAYKRK